MFGLAGRTRTDVPNLGGSGFSSLQRVAPPTGLEPAQSQLRTLLPAFGTGV